MLHLFGPDACKLPQTDFLTETAIHPGAFNFTNGAHVVFRLPNKTFGKVAYSHLVVDGLAGTVGKAAVLKFVETYLGAKVQVTINNQSVEKGGTGTITYESTPHSEVKIDALLRNAAGYGLQSVWGDVPVNVIFRRVSSSLARRWNGTAGAQVMADVMLELAMT